MSFHLRVCLFLCWLVSAAALPATAQSRFTLSGTIKDARSGEDLAGTTVRVKEQPTIGAAANAYGFFTLTLPAGTYTLEISFLGYQPQTQTVNLTQNVRLDVRLREGGQQLQEVQVTAKASEATISRTQMGVETMDLKQINKVPVIFGEKDVIKTLTLLPGVKAGGEGNGGFFVRGGAADQNLILLDEATVYNASHLLGFFSTFNSDALKDLTVYKGNMPAQYGGRLSSVVDLRMKEGNNQQFHANGGIGLISSRLAVEGPLGPKSLRAHDSVSEAPGSFLVAARRTYADVLLRTSSQFANTSLYFYDLNAKANYKLGARDRLYLSGYLGRDVLGLSQAFSNSYGNKTATLRWNHLFTDRLFSNSSLIYSDYDFLVTITAGEADFNIRSRIRDFNLKQDFEYYPSTAHTVRFGLNAIHHTIKPGQLDAAANSGLNSTTDRTKYSLETAGYVSDEWQLSPRFTLTTGLRYSAQTLLGGTYSTYDAAGNETSETTYSSTKAVKTYWNPEPRLSASFQLDENTNLKAGYARNVQNIHLLSNSSATSPTDIYLATTLNVKPEKADQVAVGYYRKLGADGAWAFSAETYYKWLYNQIDYRDGTELRGNQDVEADLLYGKGRAYGIEFLIKKETGRLTGWIGYTYSRTQRQFAGINGGAWYAARQDKPHDLSIVGVYQLTPRWSVAGTWVASTGSAVTFPVGKYTVNDQVVSYYGARNADRMPAYLRLDLGATYERPARGRFQSSWNFSVYNALGRENAYSISFEQDPDDATRTQAVQTSLFRWVPSVTYNFKF